jgi:hypothetical protein
MPPITGRRFRESRPAEYSPGALHQAASERLPASRVPSTPGRCFFGPSDRKIRIPGSPSGTPIASSAKDASTRLSSAFPARPPPFYGRPEMGERDRVDLVLGRRDATIASSVELRQGSRVAKHGSVLPEGEPDARVVLSLYDDPPSPLRGRQSINSREGSDAALESNRNALPRQEEERENGENPSGTDYWGMDSGRVTRESEK